MHCVVIIFTTKLLVENPFQKDLKDQKKTQMAGGRQIAAEQTPAVSPDPKPLR